MVAILEEQNLIESFMDLTENELSPEIFRRWSGISMIAGAMERRIWAKVGPRFTYPNLYVLLVAPPGVGKYVIELVRDLWSNAKEPGTRLPAFKVAPDSMSKASLMDTLADSKRTILKPQGGMETFHSLLVAAEEFGVLLPEYDKEYIGSLNSIFNNKDKHEERRRASIVKHLDIENPTLNMLGGVQPGWLASSFPEEAWSTGLTRRMIMVYAPEGIKRNIFEERDDLSGLKTHISQRLGKISKMYGQMRWEQVAADHVRDWDLDGGKPAPTHTKLVNYNRTRTLLAIKLAMVASLARSTEMAIRLQDVEQAIAWLLHAETIMPDIFRAMLGKSDIQMVEEMHFLLMAQYVRNGRKPIKGQMLYAFLQQRVPSDKVEKIIDIAEKANFIARVAGTTDYIPKAKTEHLVE